MLVVETVVRIRREHAGGKPIKAIARDLRLSRKVWIGVDAGPPSIQVYDFELATETGTMTGSPSAPITPTPGPI